MPAIAPRGSLEQTSLPHLLLELMRTRFNGHLHLTRQRLQKSFMFREGTPIFAESNLASETLGVQLMDSGRLSREDYSRASEYVARKRCREGQALLELGLIEARDLFLSLKEQVRARLLDCFGWPDGEYRMEASAAPPAEAQPFRADVYALVQEGIETHWSPDRILGDLADAMNLCASRNRRLSKMQERLLSDDSVEALINALDGSRTLWRAIQEARTPRALAAAWLIHEIRAVDLREQPLNGENTPRVEPEVEVVVATNDSGPRKRSDARARPTDSVRAPVDDARADALRSEIEEKHANYTSLGHYALLGMTREASDSDIKRAYLVAAKRYHPDALARLGIEPETSKRAAQVFAAIAKAYAVVGNPARREAYDASLDSEDSDQDAERLVAAEHNFRKGAILLRSGNFRGALDYLKAAVDLWPNEAAYQDALGWASFKMTPPDPKAARDHLERARELDPLDGAIAHHLALVLKAVGAETEAATMLAEARRLDPSIN